MTNSQGRVSAGVPAGGQFTGRTFTDSDIALIEATVESAARASNLAHRQYALGNARLIAAKILKEHPTAVTVRLEESDQEGCAWDAVAILDADGSELDAQDVNDDLTLEFWALPSDPPFDEEKNAPDEEFNWLRVFGSKRHGTTAELDLHRAAEAGEQA